MMQNIGQRIMDAFLVGTLFILSLVLTNFGS